MAQAQARDCVERHIRARRQLRDKLLAEVEVAQVLVAQLAENDKGVDDAELQHIEDDPHVQGVLAGQRNTVVHLHMVHQVDVADALVVFSHSNGSILRPETGNKLLCADE